MSERLERGFGHRKIGGLYLVGSGFFVGCDRLPLLVPRVCAASGEGGVQFSRAFQWVHQSRWPLKPYDGCGLERCRTCPIGMNPERCYGFMWIGQRYYPTPELFVSEAVRYGVSKRIAHVPRLLHLGSDWVMLAHMLGRHVRCEDVERCVCNPLEMFPHDEMLPAVVYVFKPTRVEMPLPVGTPWSKLRVYRRHKITPVLCEVDEHGDAIEGAREWSDVREIPNA